MRKKKVKEREDHGVTVPRTTCTIFFLSALFSFVAAPFIPNIANTVLKSLRLMPSPSLMLLNTCHASCAVEYFCNTLCLNCCSKDDAAVVMVGLSLEWATVVIAAVA